MEGKHKIQSPPPSDHLRFISPSELPDFRHGVGESISSPSTGVWPSLTNKLSEDSSKHDSGYCSATPKSSESFQRIFVGKQCQFCNTYDKNYAQSTPNCRACRLKRNDSFESRSSPVECLQPIFETKMPPTPLYSAMRPLMIYEEAMDTSLYPDGMDVEEHGEEAHCFNLSQSGIGEENSIDFAESAVSLSVDRPKDIDQVAENRDNVCEKVKNTETEHFFSPEGQVFSSSVVSPKINNEKTPVKTRNSRKFLVAAKKVHTLNLVVRSFTLTGIDKLDFFYQLSCKVSCLHVVSKILSFLPAKDLDSVRVVSKTWNKIFYNDYLAFTRWNSYKTSMLMWKENYTSPTKAGSSGGKRRGRGSPFSPLHALNNTLNQVNSPSPKKSSPAVSPRSARFRSYQRAGLTLKKGDRLLPCPKCSFATRDHGSPTVQCSRTGCRHRFCVWCRNEVTPETSHRCPPSYAPGNRYSSYKIPLIGGEVCKRNLRRLL